MPVFDLKNATVKLRDGYRDDGAVNFMAGYSIGATTIVVDGFTVAPEAGMEFTVGTVPYRYRLTGTPTTTSLTFTPGLLEAIADNDVINIVGRALEAKLGEGNLSFDETQNIEYILNRGVIDEVREGDEAPLDVTLDAQYQFVTGHTSDPGGGLPTIRDALKKVGLASGWTSSDIADPCRPYSIDIELFYEPICDTVYGEVVTLQYFRFEKLSFDAKAGTINVTGKCNVAGPLMERFAQL